MNFTSQICTTKEQSERLLALGLKKETADMEIHSFKDDEQETFETGYANKGYMEPEFAEIVDCFPAWSFHRLIEMMPKIIIKDLIQWYLCLTPYYTDQVTYENYNGEIDYLYKGRSKSLYDNIIDCIEWLIKEGHFNKEYLK